jgi:hypothetical protein
MQRRLADGLWQLGVHALGLHLSSRMRSWWRLYLRRDLRPLEPRAVPGDGPIDKQRTIQRCPNAFESIGEA